VIGIGEVSAGIFSFGVVVVGVFRSGVDEYFYMNQQQQQHAAATRNNFTIAGSCFSPTGGIVINGRFTIEPTNAAASQPKNILSN